MRNMGKGDYQVKGDSGEMAGNYIYWHIITRDFGG